MKLDFSYKNLEEIPDEYRMWIIYFEEINLSCNAIYELPDDCSHFNTSVLDLSYNNLNELPGCSINWRVGKIFLTGNHISSIPKNLWDKCYNKNYPDQLEEMYTSKWQQNLLRIYDHPVIPMLDLSKVPEYTDTVAKKRTWFKRILFCK